MVNKANSDNTHPDQYYDNYLTWISSATIIWLSGMCFCAYVCVCLRVCVYVCVYVTQIWDINEMRCAVFCDGSVAVEHLLFSRSEQLHQTQTLRSRGKGFLRQLNRSGQRLAQFILRHVIVLQIPWKAPQMFPTQWPTITAVSLMLISWVDWRAEW